MSITDGNSTDPRYIQIANRDISVKEKDVHKRANNIGTAQYMDKPMFLKLIKYLKDPMLQEQHQKSKSMYWNNKDSYVEFTLNNGKMIKITYEFKNYPTPKSPNRELQAFVLYVDGEYVCYRSSQEKMLDYISKEILKEKYREDKKSRDLNR